MDRDLILVKHSLPQIDPDSVPSRWTLAEEGRRRAGMLAAVLASYSARTIVSSPEPKAHETARIIAAADDLPVAVIDELHEHERDDEPFLPRREFEDRIARFFAQPDRLVFGRETAPEALLRFTRAVSSIIEAHPDGSIAIVSHGTVITLFVSACTGVEPFRFWQRLGLPSFVVLALPDLTLRHTQFEIEPVC